MTLLTTEIHLDGDAAFVIFAADRRISRGGRAIEDATKILRVRGSPVGVGFFGLAELASPRESKPMSVLLTELADAMPPGSSPAAFAELLLQKLRAEMPYNDVINEPIGFHVCGFASDGEPEFWYVRNIDDQGFPTRKGFESREDFRARDRGRLLPGQYAIYRNGDLQAHIAAWAAIDESLGKLLGSPTFRALKTPEDHELWVKTKMELIGSFYQRFATEQIIGNPIDSFSISRAA